MIVGNGIKTKKGPDLREHLAQVETIKDPRFISKCNKFTPLYWIVRNDKSNTLFTSRCPPSTVRPRGRADRL